MYQHVTSFYMERRDVMVKKEEFYYESRDAIHKIRAMKWIPDTDDILCVFQITHGMAEHIERYDEFAAFLAQRGILVVANDHLGHGKSATDKADFGYFCEKDAATVVVRDVHRLKKIIQEQNPGKPYFILGHSMGSFIFRNYLCRYGKGIDGAIIMGTGTMPTAVIKVLMILTNIIAMFRGWKHPSQMIDTMAFGNYNSRIKEPRTKSDWLSKDEAIVDMYIEDEACGFPFTLNGFHTMAKLIDNLRKKDYLDKMPKDLPVLFVSGAEDPVGGYGEGVKEVYAQFEKLGMQNISMKLYENDRHEILNENDRQDVFQDIFEWITKQLGN